MAALGSGKGKSPCCGASLLPTLGAYIHSKSGLNVPPGDFDTFACISCGAPYFRPMGPRSPYDDLSPVHLENDEGAPYCGETGKTGTDPEAITCLPCLRKFNARAVAEMVRAERRAHDAAEIAAKHSTQNAEPGKCEDCGGRLVGGFSDRVGMCFHCEGYGAIYKRRLEPTVPGHWEYGDPIPEGWAEYSHTCGGGCDSCHLKNGGKLPENPVDEMEVQFGPCTVSYIASDPTMEQAPPTRCPWIRGRFRDSEV